MSADIEWEEIETPAERLDRLEKSMKQLAKSVQMLIDLIDEHESSIKVLQRLVGKLAAIELGRQKDKKDPVKASSDPMYG